MGSSPSSQAFAQQSDQSPLLKIHNLIEAATQQQFSPCAVQQIRAGRIGFREQRPVNEVRRERAGGTSR
jgi:hypothetical protein